VTSTADNYIEDSGVIQSISLSFLAVCYFPMQNEAKS
jgi:hypothetical protein